MAKKKLTKYLHRIEMSFKKEQWNLIENVNYWNIGKNWKV